MLLSTRFNIQNYDLNEFFVFKILSGGNRDNVKFLEWKICSNRDFKYRTLY